MMSDIEILESVYGGRMLKEMSAIEFMGYVARKINGAPISDRIRELQMVVASPPLTNNLTHESKLEYCRKLLAVGISLT